MPKKLFNIIDKYGLITMFYAQPHIYSKEEIEGRKTSSQIQYALAIRLERRRKIREAIQIYRQAASMYPPGGYKSFKHAAETAQNNYMNNEAATLWLESIYFTSNFSLKLKSLIKFFRECTRSKIQT